uniref:Mitochondrial GTPase 1 n=1 Tax=Acartia pacifica TaxID=335913 RepID=A0A0U2KCW0_ACAPC|nr:mitochondrial GTPase 1 [Acartia pacifica]
MSKIVEWKKLVDTSFRKKYDFTGYSAKNWFPGHMHKGLKAMQRKITNVDCVIEVHDARIPLSGRNTTFKETVSGVKPHLLVLNKEDLVPKADRKLIIKKIKEADPIVSDIVFTNGNDFGCKGVKSILPKAVKLIEHSDRFHRAGNPDHTIMIIGIPNVGKSTIINQLRNSRLKIGGKAAPTGDKPGITKALQEKIRVCNKPLVYLLDTPGISKPNVRSMHAGMKLAACNTLNDLVVGELSICDYILWYLNKSHEFGYVDYLGLKQPEDDHLLMLTKAAIANGLMTKRTTFGKTSTIPNIDLMAQRFLKWFRSGDFGRIYFDQDELDDIKLNDEHLKLNYQIQHNTDNDGRIKSL